MTKLIKGSYIRPCHLNKNATLIGSKGTEYITGKITKSTKELSDGLNCSDKKSHTTKYKIGKFIIFSTDSIRILSPSSSPV